MPFTKVKKLNTIKLLEESIGRTLHDINPKIFLVPLCRIIKIITKINGIQLNLKALHSKGNHKQNKKTTLRMGENICKLSNWQGINHQNAQVAHAAWYEKKKKKNQKMGRRPKQTYSEILENIIWTS